MFQPPSPPDALPPHTRIPHCFAVQREVFAIIGIDLTSLEQTIFNRFLTWIPMFSVLTLCGPMIMLGIQSRDELDKMANALAPVWQGIVVLAKFAVFIRNKRKIVRFVRKVWFWNLEAQDQELKILIEENRYDYNVSLFYRNVVYFTGVLAVTAPFIVAGFKAWKGFSYFESLDMPLKGLYPLDPHKSYFAYGFNLIWDILTIHYTIGGTVGFDTLFSWFMRNISAQFRILNLRFTTVANEAKVRMAHGNYKENEFWNSIIQCVKYHRDVIDLVNEFDYIYRPIVFIQFLISCAQIAVLIFQLAAGGDRVVMLFNVCFMIIVSTQLLVYGYGGQRIQDLSASVCENIYQSFPWHDLSTRSKKLLLLIMMRAQKPCNITGIFFVADMNLAVWVFRTAGSFMTMMISMDKKDIQIN